MGAAPQLGASSPNESFSQWDIPLDRSILTDSSTLHMGSPSIWEHPNAQSPTGELQGLSHQLGCPWALHATLC